MGKLIDTVLSSRKSTTSEKAEIIHISLKGKELGAIKSIEYLPVNQEALKEVLRAEKERRTKQAKTTTVSI